MKYVFVGSSESQILQVVNGAVVSSVELTEYGQEVELDAEAAHNALAGGAAIVPAKDFTSDKTAMSKLAAELILTVRDPGVVPVIAETKPREEVIEYGDR